MSVEVIMAVARAIEEQALDRPIEVVWHGGEPLASGPKHLRELLEPFEQLRKAGKVVHVIQTNATLINKEWCQLFRDYNFYVGVSIDGPAWMTSQRVNLRGISVHTQIRRGIGRLLEAEIPYSAIAVVNNSNIAYPRELYQFFCDLGCLKVGFNVEELEGVNTNADQVEEKVVLAFWKGILEAWSQNPQIKVREIKRALSFANAVLDRKDSAWNIAPIDLFPTVAWNGEVILLSPELAGIQSEKYRDFVAGNVLETPLVQIVRSGSNNLYVSDFVAGVKQCQDTCPYFNFCRGGQAANKFFERGTTAATETAFCRNTKQRLLDAVIQ
jgi:uncharacterized protein